MKMMMNEEEGSLEAAAGADAGAGTLKQKTKLVLDDDDSDSDFEEEDDDENETQVINKKNMNKKSKSSTNKPPSSKRRSSKENSNNGGIMMMTARPRAPRPSMVPRPSLAVSGGAGGGGGGNNRRRRRSSARFLQRRRQSSISSIRTSYGGGGRNSVSQQQQNQRNLSELYKKAIRMNAENRINASNSWNLPLIEHIDKFVLEEGDEEEEDEEENEEESDHRGEVAGAAGATTTTKKKQQRVNFTKASCTLDASIKIYSYRVDDVHLTSYKVLANLHRNSNNNKQKNGGRSNELDGGGDDNDGDENATRTGRKKKSENGPTLETNIANINLNKLDSAFDIDPLFHKMSKAFDEGGAKGLLLVNLGLGNKCNVVFDSTETTDTDNNDNDSIEDAEFAKTDDEAETPKEEDEEEKGEPNQDDEDNSNNNASPNNQNQSSTTTTEEGMIDITDLTSRLFSTLNDGVDGETSLENLQLVPQLSGLRAQYDALENEGFVSPSGVPLNTAAPMTASKRYAAREYDEKQADMSIHKEALEKSARKSAQKRSLFDGEDDDDDNNPMPMYAPDDYGGGDDGDDDDDYGGNFSFFVADDDAARFSTESGQANNTSSNNWIDTEANTQTTALLDALSSTSFAQSQTQPMLFATQSQYAYLDSQALDNLMQDRDTSSNVWAGARHWKRSKARRSAAAAAAAAASQSQKTPGKKKKATKPSRKKKKDRATSTTAVSYDEVPDDLLADIQQRPPQPKAKKTKKSKSKKAVAQPYQDPLQWSQAVVTKHGQTDHLLPIDANLSVGDLSKLFLLSNAVLSNQQAVMENKQSGADKAGGKTVGFALAPADNDDDDDDYGGGGFAMGDYDDDDHDNDGPGFSFAAGGDGDNDDDDEEGDYFGVPELDDVRKVDKVRVNYATVAKKVDVKRLKRDLWCEFESKLPIQKPAPTEEEDDNNNDESEDDREVNNDEEEDNNNTNRSDDDDDDDEASANGRDSGGSRSSHQPMTFQTTVADMEASKSQADVTLPFYFICVLHLANEKGLKLESQGLHDFNITLDENVNDDEEV